MKRGGCKFGGSKPGAVVCPQMGAVVSQLVPKPKESVPPPPLPGSEQLRAAHPPFYTLFSPQTRVHLAIGHRAQGLSGPAESSGRWVLTPDPIHAGRAALSGVVRTTSSSRGGGLGGWEWGVGARYCVSKSV